MAALVAAAFLVLGCGDDEGRVQEEPSATTTSPTTPTTTPTDAPTDAPADTVPEGEQTATSPEDGAAPPRSPEDGPGGAGDEEPVSSQALLTGRGGRIAPRIVRVPPFIAIRVELRSSDGARYALRFGKRGLRADADSPSASTTFDGLSPGRRLVGRGGSGRVVIEASAEPGP